MDLMTLAALCAMSATASGQAPPAGTNCADVAKSYRIALVAVAPKVSDQQGRDAIARVAYAEAGNQGDTGLAAVVYTILNRLVDGGFGNSLVNVLDAPGQFEPVSKAGGWQRLAPRSAIEMAHVETILNLALDGRLPDPTNGARYFQNPTIVAARVAAGIASPGLVDFGGNRPVAVIRDHAFYAQTTAGPTPAGALPSLFVPVQTTQAGSAQTAMSSSPHSASNSLFVPVQSHN